MNASLESAPSLRCPSCKNDVALPDVLTATASAGRTFERSANVVNCRCPSCHRPFEARFVTGAVYLGYTYAAGGLHFAAMEEVKVPGLEASASASAVVVTLGGATWSLAATGP